jgi:DNA-binding response OmpR family regulator/DNA-binding CsgD family transcriptional regulator
MEGFEVVLAENGSVGIELALKFTPDLILCDIMMPGIDGYDVYQSIRTVDKLFEVPFIYITALSERKNLRKGMDLGVDDYLVKPFTIEELLSSINSRLKKQSFVRAKIKEEIKRFKGEIDSLLAQNEQQKRMNDKISNINAEIQNKLDESHSQLMSESLRNIELSTILDTMSKQISEEIKRHGDTKHKSFLIDLKNRIKNGSMILDNWAIFQIRFNEKYPDFASAMLTQHPHLTQQDLIILSAIYVNLNTHQISAILGISPDSVRKSKYRLKKKLGLTIDQKLILHIHKLHSTQSNLVT